MSVNGLMNCLSGYLDMHVAAAVGKGQNAVRLQSLRKGWRRWPALTLPMPEPWGRWERMVWMNSMEGWLRPVICCP